MSEGGKRKGKRVKIEFARVKIEGRWRNWYGKEREMNNNKGGKGLRVKERERERERKRGRRKKKRREGENRKD